MSFLDLCLLVCLLGVSGLFWVLSVMDPLLLNTSLLPFLVFGISGQYDAIFRFLSAPTECLDFGFRISVLFVAGFWSPSFVSQRFSVENRGLLK